ncbi:hypothetical protein, partial [Salmonella sp. s54925]|uniref:hypothetical protein n=1 Tax=Salmonella sp. s54925 TaxID=3159674 RepID=UPI00397F6006
KIPSLAGEKWRAMNDEEKKEYVEKADAAKQKYDGQMKEYLAKNPDKSAQKVKKSKAKVKEASDSDEEEEEDEDDENDDVDDDDDEEEEDEDDDSD